MTLNAIVVDDEQPARERLRAMLLELPGVAVLGEAAEGEAALRLCLAVRPDIVFLDVRMPGMDGLELARHLALLPDPPAVVFTTAHDEHAMEAFDAQAVGYLLKPVRRERLLLATQRAQRMTQQQIAAFGTTPAPRNQIAIRVRDGLKLVRVDDISCFIAEQKYTTVRHAGGTDLIEDSLRVLATEFATRFARIHRNSLVNLRHIEAIERGADGHTHVRLRGVEERLAVSRRLVADLKERFEA